MQFVQAYVNFHVNAISTVHFQIAELRLSASVSGCEGLTVETYQTRGLTSGIAVVLSACRVRIHKTSEG